MTGTERLSVVIRSKTQSTWSVPVDLVWSTRDPDGEVRFIIAPKVALRILTPREDWYRFIDERSLTAYAVKRVTTNPDGSVCVEAVRTPVYQLEAARIRQGVPSHAVPQHA